MRIYADTSFVISWFVPDANHAAALAAIRAHRQAPRIPWTPWNALEFNNAVRGLTARGVLAAGAPAALAAQVRAALQADDLTVAPLPAYQWWLEAEGLSQAHTTRLNIRTLDLLHVAAARLLGATEFWTFDARQTALVKAAGLKAGP